MERSFQNHLQAMAEFRTEVGFVFFSVSVLTCRGESDLRTHTDEDQGTDNEICTIAARTIHSGGPQLSPNNEHEATFTVDQALEAIGFGVFHLKLSFLAGLSWIADAMEMMILGVLGPQLHCEWELPSYQVAFIASVVFIGMGFGAAAWGNLSDKLGRKAGLVMSMWWTLYFGFLSAFSPVYSWFLVLRGLVGFGIGGTPLSVTLYSEFLPVKARGVCIMLIASFWALGVLLEVLLAYFVMPTLGWRWLLGLSTIPLAVFLCFCFWLPESPRFDVLTGRTDKAVATLTRIAKENGKILPRGRIVSYAQNDRGQVKDLFSSQYRKTTILLWLIWFVTGFSYYGIVLLTTELFQDGHVCGTTQGAKIEPRCSLECNYLTKDDYKDLLWTTFAEFPGLLVILGAVEYIGRKKGLALGFFVFALCILPLFGCIGRTAVTVSIFIARAFISGGFQAVYVYTSEAFPTDSRALAVGTCSALSKLGALITPFVAQVVLRTSVYLTLALYCGCSLLAGVASLLLPIETLGRTLLESTSAKQSHESPHPPSCECCRCLIRRSESAE